MPVQADNVALAAGQARLGGAVRAVRQALDHLQHVTLDAANWDQKPGASWGFNAAVPDGSTYCFLGCFVFFFINQRCGLNQVYLCRMAT